MEYSLFPFALTPLWGAFTSGKRFGAAARGKPDQQMDEAVN
jgi:hypothetical protein